MHRFNTLLASVAVLGGGRLIEKKVFAHCGTCAGEGKNIVSQLEQHKLRLAKIITTAEQHSQGRAVTFISELDDSDRALFEVYCIVGDKIMMCEIDGVAGKVKEMKEVQAFPITDGKSSHAAGQPDHDPAGKVITNQLVDVGCGNCIYSMNGVKGCQLAVKIDDKTYLVTGADDVDAHKFCSVAKKALVSGQIEGNKFAATKFEVQS